MSKISCVFYLLMDREHSAAETNVITDNPGKFVWPLSDQAQSCLSHVLLTEKHHLIPFCSHSNWLIQGVGNSEMNTLSPPQHLAAPGKYGKQMGVNVSSKWNPTLHENVPAEEETGFLLVSFAIDSKCEFFGSKITVSALLFSSFGHLSSWPGGLWSLGHAEAWDFPEKAPDALGKLVSPKSSFPTVSVAGAEIFTEKLAR